MPQRTISHFVHFVLLCVCMFSVDATVQASSLFGRVIEVSSGDVITIFNLNRPVRVKLLGVDAPELAQPFGDVARKHLSDLVYDKSVIVEYSGIAADSSLRGRVLLNGTDIGAQMIRDGAAWFDLSNQNRLSTDEREIYQQSEQAARSERRGLWQTENPVAPWEFVKAESVRKYPVARVDPSLPAPKARAERPPSELTNLSLMTSRSGNTGAVEPTIKDNFVKAMSATPKAWEPLRPEGENFSIQVPAEGINKTLQEPAGDETVDVHSYLAREGMASYIVTWMVGPKGRRTEKSALQEAIRGVIHGAGKGYGKAGGQQAFSCGAITETDISMNGYTGTEFDLTSCTLPGKVRAYIRINGDRLQSYLAAVFFIEEEENVERFLQSFKVGSAKRRAK